MRGADTMGVDTMGYDDDAVIGQFMNYLANRRPGAMAARGQQHYPQQVPRVGNVYTRPPLAARPQNSTSMLRSFVGLGFATWTGTDGADKQLTIEPQESFRGERLVIEVLATSGAAGLVVVRQLQVGVQPQQPDTSQPAPASMFAAQVTYSHLDLQIAKPGINITVTLGVTAAPGAGETVTASAGLYGEWVR
jgi:hypothetical protein